MFNSIYHDFIKNFFIIAYLLVEKEQNAVYMYIFMNNSYNKEDKFIVYRKLLLHFILYD
jgi:hypothetical protein